MTRRQLLYGAAVGGAAASLVPGIMDLSAAAAVPQTAATPTPIPLPGADQVMADFQTMVDFGSRLTGSPQQNDYIAWLEEQLTAAGVEMVPCSSYELTRWTVGDWGLTVDGSDVKVAAYCPRCLQTDAAGVTGPLVYGGAAPLPDVNLGDISGLVEAIEAYPDQLISFVEALGSDLGNVEGSIMLIDLPMPLPITVAPFLAISTYLQWAGHSIADWADSDYKRAWLAPGLVLPVQPWEVLKPNGVVFILDASYEAIAGGYMPFVQGFQSLPVLFVDRDTGTQLRAQAAKRPSSTMTVTATLDAVRTPSLVGILHGDSTENVILNTHSDGEGFVEENCGVCLVELARYFGTLPAEQRLSRSLVFSIFTGHMDPQLPETQGFINDNPGLVADAAAALTIEHFGCTEWIDDSSGYYATGNPELMAIWTTQGPMFDAVKETLIASGLPRTALLRPPVQFGVGAAFQSSGVPQIGAIAGPTYLLNIDSDGDIDKLDPQLAADQIAFIADLIAKLEGYTAAELRTGDPTLGKDAHDAPGTGGVGFEYATCDAAPTPAAIRLRWTVAERPVDGTVAIRLATASGEVDGVTVALHQGTEVVARTFLASLGTRNRTIRLRRLNRRAYTPGRYRLVVSDRAGVTLTSHLVTLR